MGQETYALANKDLQEGQHHSASLQNVAGFDEISSGQPSRIGAEIGAGAEISGQR